MKGLEVALLATLALSGAANAQQGRLARLPASGLDVQPPSSRVVGPPGSMRITDRTCPTRPREETRRRIVDIAIQEWGFFGFQIVDQSAIIDSGSRPWPRSTPWLGPVESARVAGSIAGYWSVTPRGAWILERQNAEWKGPEGVAARWRDAWSAAFVSWVMCESGLGDESQFRRAIAHHSYIDQAIVARGQAASPAAFEAFDVGERPLEPGDMLCSARRSAYRTIAERRRDLGEGIRSHCDIAIRIDPTGGRVLAIGGNVRGAVSLKILPATFKPGARGQLVATSVGRDRRTAFAHLKLRGAPIESEALESSATVRTFLEGGRTPNWLKELTPGP